MGMFVEESKLVYCIYCIDISLESTSYVMLRAIWYESVGYNH